VNPYNPFPIRYVLNAALERLDRWVRLGEPALAADRLELVDTGNGLEIARDEHGNALGGIRYPAVEAPIGTYQPTNQPSPFCYYWGSFFAFDEQMLFSLYPSDQSHLDQVQAQTEILIGQGFLLPPDAVELQQEAEEFISSRGGPIPALSSPALGALALLLLGVGAVAIRRLGSRSRL
jgi:hypothetical protein